MVGFKEKDDNFRFRHVEFEVIKYSKSNLKKTIRDITSKTGEK